MYKGGPISKAEHMKYRRENFVEGDKMAVRKKRQGNDDSESDNSDEYRRSIAKQPKGKNKGMLM